MRFQYKLFTYRKYGCRKSNWKDYLFSWFRQIIRKPTRVTNYCVTNIIDHIYTGDW